jgi:hypothetical protein
MVPKIKSESGDGLIVAGPGRVHFPRQGPDFFVETFFDCEVDILGVNQVLPPRSTRVINFFRPATILVPSVLVRTRCRASISTWAMDATKS